MPASAPIANGGDLFRSLSAQPYGKAQEDAPYSRPFNVSDETVIVRVRNLSALRPRRVFLDHIGLGRGGEQYAMEMAEKGRTINLDMLYTQFARFGGNGRDISPTADRIDPIDAYVMWDGKPYVIPAKDEHGKPAPWVEIPEGIYDLYFGNHKRLFEMGPKERANELEAVRTRRRDYCVRNPVSKDFMAENEKQGADKDNPFAFLVFDRKVVKPEAVAIDMDRVYSGRAMEV